VRSAGCRTNVSTRMLPNGLIEDQVVAGPDLDPVASSAQRLAKFGLSSGWSRSAEEMADWRSAVAAINRAGTAERGLCTQRPMGHLGAQHRRICGGCGVRQTVLGRPQFLYRAQLLLVHMQQREHEPLGREQLSIPVLRHEVARSKWVRRLEVG
jgi:hypothetical protein